MSGPATERGRKSRPTEAGAAQERAITMSTLLIKRNNYGGFNEACLV